MEKLRVSFHRVEVNDKELESLELEVKNLNDRLEKGYDYLMQVKPSEMTVEDALEALGFNRNGLRG